MALLRTTRRFASAVSPQTLVNMIKVLQNNQNRYLRTSLSPMLDKNPTSSYRNAMIDKGQHESFSVADGKQIQSSPLVNKPNSIDTINQNQHNPDMTGVKGHPKQMLAGPGFSTSEVPFTSSGPVTIGGLQIDEIQKELAPVPPTETDVQRKATQGNVHLI